jgi:hypothetical protein
LCTETSNGSSYLRVRMLLVSSSGAVTRITHRSLLLATPADQRVKIVCCFQVACTSAAPQVCRGHELSTSMPIELSAAVTQLWGHLLHAATHQGVQSTANGVITPCQGHPLSELPVLHINRGLCVQDKDPWGHVHAGSRLALARISLLPGGCLFVPGHANTCSMQHWWCKIA